MQRRKSTRTHVNKERSAPYLGGQCGPLPILVELGGAENVDELYFIIKPT